MLDTQGTAGEHEHRLPGKRKVVQVCAQGTQTEPQYEEFDTNDIKRSRFNITSMHDAMQAYMKASEKYKVAVGSDTLTAFERLQVVEEVINSLHDASCALQVHIKDAADQIPLLGIDDDQTVLNDLEKCLKLLGSGTKDVKEGMCVALHALQNATGDGN